MPQDYEAFLATKLQRPQLCGLAPGQIPARLFPFQQRVTTWALERGRAALFLDTGLGKTAVQLAWAQEVARQGGDVLILAPLAVAQQTVAEGALMDIPVTLCRDGTDVQPGITITNYERLHRFDTQRFVGIVLDESSVLKAFDGKTRTQLIEQFRQTPYRLCCTATPAPNDFMELGNHAEFLGVLTRSEMLATYFIHDGGATSQWRLKGHGAHHFWRWVASWAIALTHPRYLGDATIGFDLPPLHRHEHLVSLDVVSNGLTLFPMEAHGLQEQRAARRAGLTTRMQTAVQIVLAEPEEPWLVWCALNDEADAMTRALPGAVQIAGRDTIDDKESRLLAFVRGETPILVTKPSIAGWGLNLQHCARMLFVGVDNSFESWYQAVRRCWRFGQRRDVHAHVVLTDIEAGILRTIKRKEEEALLMHTMMTEAVIAELGWTQPVALYAPDMRMLLPEWLTSTHERDSDVQCAQSVS